MTTAWVLNELAILATALGALLVFLYLGTGNRFAGELQTLESRNAFDRYQRRSRLAVGLLAAWLVLQDLAVILF